MFPTHIEDAKIYDADNNMELIGIATVTLPTIEKKKTTLEGMGVMGTMEFVNETNIENMTVSLTFRGITDKNPNLLKGNKTLEMRAALNFYDSALKTYTEKQFRAVTSGMTSSFEMGDIEISSTMSLKVEMNLQSYKFWLDKKSKIEIDVLNGIYKIDGTDLRQTINDIVG